MFLRGELDKTYSVHGKIGMFKRKWMEYLNGRGG